MEQLRDLVFELDCEISNIGNTLMDLEDAKVFLSNLEVSMSDAVHSGEEMVYFHNHHREVRILFQLLRQALTDLNKSHNNADILQKTLFNEVVQKKRRSVTAHTQNEIERTMQHNRKAFVETFSREPENDDEVLIWVTSILEKCKKKAV